MVVCFLCFESILHHFIPDICQNRHNRRWCTFFKPADFFPQRRERDCFEQGFSRRRKNTNPKKTWWGKYHNMVLPNTPSQIPNVPPHATNTPPQWQRHQVLHPYKEMRQPKHQVRQPKHQVHLPKHKVGQLKQHIHHLQKGYKNQNAKYANQNTT